MRKESVEAGREAGSGWLDLLFYTNTMLPVSILDDLWSVVR